MIASSDPEPNGDVPPLPTMRELMAGFPRAGRVLWIGARPARRAPLIALAEVEAIAGRGLAGDHYRPGSRGSRQVTLIQAEHLAVVAALLGGRAVDPGRLRRNLVIEGINLLALKGVRFRIGAAVLEGTGPCHPCSRMEEALGPGGYNAMRGHGGVNARVILSGRISVGDRVEVVALAPSQTED